MSQEHDSGDVAVDETDVYVRLHEYQEQLNASDPLVPVAPKKSRNANSGKRAKIAIAAVAISALTIGGAAVLLTAGGSDPSAPVAAAAPEEQSAVDDAPIAPAPEVVLDSATLPFEDDSAQLSNPAEAKARLSLIAASAKSSDQQIKLTGTTATDGTDEGRAKLSLARAEAVKTILVDLGVPAARIATEGVGINHPSHVDDRDENNQLIPDKAATNRTVILTIE